MKAEKGYRIIFKYIYNALLCNFKDCICNQLLLNSL